jgi:hypothetical protein
VKEAQFSSQTGTSRRIFLGGTGGALLASAAISRPAVNLERITQELANALAPGNVSVWQQWTHPQFVVTDENGVRTERQQFLSEMRPLPPGTSGSIKVTDFKVTQTSGVQVTTYVLDELEHYHGEDLQARYRQTDTWVPSASGWRLLASQIIALRTDPPAVELPATLWSEYSGRYGLPDGLELEITTAGSSAALRKSTGTPRPLKAELKDLLFVPADPRIRYIVQRDGSEQVVALIQRRESWDIVWRRQS